MPWRETCAMDERVAFILAWRRSAEPMTVLCAAHGISRKTGYKWRDRFLSSGWPGLADASRAPHRPGNELSAEVRAAIVALRAERPFWGPRKLRAVLEERRAELAWPAPSTIGDLLRREGLSAPRRRRRTALPLTQPFLAATAPNDVWCADFKGWFRTGDRTRCDPLTITDAASRFLIDCRIVAPTIEGAAPVFEAAFRRHGLPRAIRSDNGAPFASIGAGGLTRLSVEWVKLGIRLERIDPGCPQQNGRHERMHGTLKAETIRPPAATAAAQQARFDAWRDDFNIHRPHEALAQTPPARRYRPALRRHPGAAPEPSYAADHAVRRVRSNGEIKWGGELVFVSEALVGEPVGITETESGAWLVRFCDVDLGLIDRRTHKLRRFAAGRPARRKAEQTGTTVTHVSGL
ncbi:integrase core domain-containing protein [Inquilinus sp. CAU 1745]|uniref:integrase core domain-containing protein n=1 Tax=Inquilinus sp. CAU 1745 TaxID=3140369 RepID=UPI00325AF677